MNLLFLIKCIKSIKTEIQIVVLVLFFIISMPIVSVFAYTHVSTPSEAGGVYDVASYPGDYYAWGNCTWWVSIRRSQIGEPIPNSWGNAATWAYYAEQNGYIVDHVPSYGAIMQISNVDHGLGHVAFVESVDPNGTWHISEMNVLGLNIVDYKALPSSAAPSYNFIHTP